MQAWLDFAKGPLFAFTFGIMIIGLFRLVILQVYLLTVRKGRRLKDVPWFSMARESLSWVVPVKHIEPGTKVFSIASFLMHIGLIIVPLLLLDHIVRWESFLGVNLPAISTGTADVLTVLTIACALLLLAYRTFRARHRLVSGPMDFFLLLLILAPFVTGFLAAHPAINPVSWEVMMLGHILSAEALFVTIPFTKLAHVVLFFFDRISAVHWQLRPGAGDRVAEALYGEEVRI